MGSELPAGYLYYLAVKPDCRWQEGRAGNLGIGTYLMRVVMSEMSRSGAGHFGSNLTTEPVRKMFESIGIERDGELFAISSRFHQDEGNVVGRHGPGTVLNTLGRILRAVHA